MGIWPPSSLSRFKTNWETRGRVALYNLTVPVVRESRNTLSNLSWLCLPWGYRPAVVRGCRHCFKHWRFTSKLSHVVEGSLQLLTGCWPYICICHRRRISETWHLRKQEHDITLSFMSSFLSHAPCHLLFPKKESRSPVIPSTESVRYSLYPS